MSTIVNDIQELSDVLKKASELSLEFNEKFVDIQSEIDDLKKSKQSLETQLSQKESEFDRVQDAIEELKKSKDFENKRFESCTQDIQKTNESNNLLKKNLVNLHQNLISFVYGDLKKLEDDLNLLDISMKHHEKYNNRPTNIALISEYSAGKTTFIQRLFKGGVAGAIEPDPTTWLAVKHSYGKTKSFKVNFTKRIEINDEELRIKFKEFLKKYQFESGFIQDGYIWEINDPTIFTKIDWGENKIVDFFKYAEDFQESIISVDWIHSEKSEEINRILKLCNIVDLPGIGGNEIHDKKTFDFISQSEFDACIILINTHEGIPNSTTLKTMKLFLENIIDKDIYWMYQKSYDGNADEFISSRKEAIINVLKKEELSEYVMHKIHSSVIIDAMGNTKDIFKAHNAITQIIVLSKLNLIDKHIKSIRLELENIKDIPPLIGQINDINPINPIDFISSYFKPNQNDSFENANKTLKSLLKIEILDEIERKNATELIEDICHKLYSGIDIKIASNKKLDLNRLANIKEILEEKFQVRITSMQKDFLHKFYHDNQLNLYYLRAMNIKAIQSIEEFIAKLKNNISHLSHFYGE